MVQSRLINFSLAFVMAAYLPLWICCATHAAAVPEPVEAEVHGCCSTRAATHSSSPASQEQHHDCTCTERASAAFATKTAAVSFEPVQSLFDLLPGCLGKVITDNTAPHRLPRVVLDASPPGGPLLDQFCLLTT